MTPEQIAELRKPFPENVIGQLPKSTCKSCAQSQMKRCDNHSWVSNCPMCKGNHSSATVHLSYVGHAAVTDRLLIVDPEWTWEPVAFDEHGLPAFTQGKNLWIRLTVGGVTRLGVGDGSSLKECIGDAIRNAAMRFGVALDLWSKDELEQTYEPRSLTPPPPVQGGGLAGALAAESADAHGLRPSEGAKS